MTDADDPLDRPVVLTVAPNGARRQKADHPALPMTAAALGKTAAACAEVGAAMIHLHVRDKDGGHTLDVDAYRDAIAAVRAEAGADLIVQVTSESVGLYHNDQQRAMVRELKPEAVSLALRELAPTPEHEPGYADFLAWCAAERIWVQHIVYTAAEAARLLAMQVRGDLHTPAPFALFVLGRYAKNRASAARDVLPYLAVWPADLPWAVCAFGARETGCLGTAAALGGHVRVGFENNLSMANGEIAPDNAARVAEIADIVCAMGRDPATPAQARRMMADWSGA